MLVILVIVLVVVILLLLSRFIVIVICRLLLRRLNSKLHIVIRVKSHLLFLSFFLLVHCSFPLENAVVHVPVHRDSRNGLIWLLAGANIWIRATSNRTHVNLGSELGHAHPALIFIKFGWGFYRLIGSWLFDLLFDNRLSNFFNRFCFFGRKGSIKFIVIVRFNHNLLFLWLGLCCGFHWLWLFFACCWFVSEEIIIIVVGVPEKLWGFAGRGFCWSGLSSWFSWCFRRSE